MILRKIGARSADILSALNEQFGEEYHCSWNSFKHGKSWAYHMYEKSITDEKSVLCAETPLIGRDQFNKTEVGCYYRIGVNFVSEFHEKNFFIPKDTTRERLDTVLKNTNTKIKPWRSDGSHVLYAMQVPGDSSLSGLDVFAAAQYHLIMMRTLTDRPIKITLHPDIKKGWGKKEFESNLINFKEFKRVVHLVGAEISETSTRSLLQDAWVTVCYTSGVGFDSVAEGVPAITLGERSFVRPITSSSLYDIENPLRPERHNWLSRIAYCQWTAEEVRNGSFRKNMEKVREDR